MIEVIVYLDLDEFSGALRWCIDSGREWAVIEYNYARDITEERNSWLVGDWKAFLDPVKFLDADSISELNKALVIFKFKDASVATMFKVKFG